jgi:hypothetical protein
MNGSSVSNNGAPSRPLWVGLPVHLVRLRIDGRRLTGEEYRAAEALAGRLILRPTDKFQSGGGASYIAELAKLSPADQGFLGAPLFNPVVERIDHRGIVLSGYETRLMGGAVQHVEQVWLVTCAATADGALAP